MGVIIDCKTLAKNIKEDTKNQIKNITSNGISLTVASILVGEDNGSIYYQNSQEKLARELGINFNKMILKEETTEEQLLEIIESLNSDDNTHGIMILLPLPKHISEEKITNSIDFNKDIDCISDLSMGKFYKGQNSFIPCTPNSIINILESLNLDFEGKEAVVIGRSNIVGKPIGELLLRKNATVTICHSKTKDLKAVCKRADILVVAIGKPKFIDKSYIKDNAIVIDVGTSSLNGKITGDVDLEDVIDKVSFITSVPGGVGTLTTTLLLRNLCKVVK
ncbi:tetrahydrofolate dehydrogenase/cyclohydrolase catalytic domain-containing protein [Clostridium fallax]|uniref:Bifunctional protein FolD n=1 Tax=Clostridium fallax TaxID=1533 RepID=A0A1M4XMZ8_9CLOT|nr:tetrahydrofolate dehydrogenase/cyclohydrolase catalytic domain-containing protein [Clostridium fallax]SHE94653.1 methenyltetrahydrofolate cyclohydrolase /5,10-methylenetetrahydrofolate dehydrogenase (NADP+) [Clostridium fallax]SQB06347.1 bifunctional 5,10-methylene-tetrahydrofolate dehydrogenase/ 5,10-methylene-tetrahydrofolate cyclohydrolase [Clostridium fallax]